MADTCLFGLENSARHWLKPPEVETVMVFTSTEEVVFLLSHTKLKTSSRIKFVIYATRVNGIFYLAQINLK